MKKIISFSLWGELPIYNIGAIQNVILAKKYFPGWICRFYHDSTVPKKIIDKLKEYDNVELVFIEKQSGSKVWKEPGQFGSIWRFYAFNDDDVEIWLSRDTDSRISPYEKKEIDKFLNSNKIIHSFRDENEPLLRAGMTSFKNYFNGKNTRILNNKKLDIKEMMNYIKKDNTPFYCDEKFLKNKLFPIYKNFYSWSKRTDGSKFPEKCGPYVGSIVDAYGYFCNKNNNTIFVNNTWIPKKNKTMDEIMDELNL